jgi:ketosteroid isomerase-like protein
MTERADDRARITDVLARYSLAVDSRDMERLSRCFTTDAIAGYWPGHDLRGREAITGFIAGAIEGFQSTQHLIGTHTFDFDGDTAWTSTYVHAAHVVAHPAGEKVVVVGGRYSDRFVLDAGHWRIAERRFEALWTTEAASTSMMPA